MKKDDTITSSKAPWGNCAKKKNEIYVYILLPNVLYTQWLQTD